jgi:serralysin
VLHGDNDADHLYGEAGDDWLYGDAGNDTLYGGPGDDHFDGGGGFDTVDYSSATTGIDTDSAWAIYLGSSEGGDTFVNVEKVVGSQFGDYLYAWNLGDNLGHTLAGGDGYDEVYGWVGNDILDGGNGNDILVGEGGRDFLTGGAGADRFDFRFTPTTQDSLVGAGNRDIVTDFEHGVDKLSIAIHDNATLADANSLSFVGQSAFTFSNQIRFDYEGSNTVVQVNLDSSATPEMEIELVGHIALTAGDFESY